MSPSCCSLVITGSRLEIASISPFFMAATALRPGADADDRHVLGLQPFLGDQRIDEEVGRGARRGDADLHALEVLERLDLRGLLLAHREHDAGEAAHLDHGLDRLALHLHADGVLIGAGDDVGRAADQRLQRLRAAAEIGDGDVEALLLEVAEPLGQRQLQVIEQPLAADAERQVFLLRALRAGCAREGERQRQRGGDEF